MDTCEYVLFRDIETYINSQYELFHTSTSFPDALNHFHQTGKLHKGIPSEPDFMKWNFADDDTLLELISDIPIKEASLYQPIKVINEGIEDFYLPSYDKIIVSKLISHVPVGIHIDDCFTILYVLRGSCSITIDSKCSMLSPGELCIISPRVRKSHSATNRSDIVFSIMIDKDIFEQSFFSLLTENTPLSYFFRQALFFGNKDHMLFMLPPSVEIRQIYQHLFQEFVRKDPLSFDLLINYTKILFSQIIRNQESTYQYYTSDFNKQAYITIPYVLKFIESNYSTISLEALAEQFNYSREYLSKIIHNYTGKTFSDLVTHVKIEKAKYYLQYTNFNITEIASFVGYNSSDHFARSFHKKTGCSPREFRKQCYNK